MAKVTWTEEALEWRAEIDRFLAKDSPTAAVRVVEGLVGRIELLASYPRVGVLVHGIEAREVREILESNYIVSSTNMRKRRIPCICWPLSTARWTLSDFGSEYPRLANDRDH